MLTGVNPTIPGLRFRLCLDAILLKVYSVADDPHRRVYDTATESALRGNHTMRIPAGLLLLLILVNPARSQDDLLACVDPDVRAGILRSVPMGATVTRTVPDPVIELRELGDFELIASIAGPSGVRAAFKTALSASAGTQRMTSLLEEAGWRDEHRGDGQGGGFVVEGATETRLLCRDGERAMIERKSAEGLTYLTIEFFPLNPIMWTCDELVSTPSETRTTPGPEIWRHLPRLTLPDDADLTPLQVETPSGGHSSASIGVTVETDLTAQNLVDHFRTELQAQGWRHDTGWSGRSSSGSIWAFSPAEDLELNGLLDVVSLGGSRYHANFRAMVSE